MHGLRACLGTPPWAHNIRWWTGGWNVVVGRGGCVDWASWFTRVPSRKVPTIPESTVSLSACSQALSIASANFACMISNCSCNRQWHPPGVPPPVVGPASEQWPHPGPTFHCVSWCLGRVGIAANPSPPPLHWGTPLTTTQEICRGRLSPGSPFPPAQCMENNHRQLFPAILVLPPISSKSKMHAPTHLNRSCSRAWVKG